MFCKNCGTELKEGAKFCVKCGTAVPLAAVAVQEEAPPPQNEPPRCAQCGAILKEGAAFCGKCGAKVVPQQKAGDAPQVEREESVAPAPQLAPDTAPPIQAATETLAQNEVEAKEAKVEDSPPVVESSVTHAQEEAQSVNQESETPPETQEGAFKITLPPPRNFQCDSPVVPLYQQSGRMSQKKSKAPIVIAIVIGIVVTATSIFVGVYKYDNLMTDYNELAGKYNELDTQYDRLLVEKTNLITRNSQVVDSLFKDGQEDYYNGNYHYAIRQFNNVIKLEQNDSKLSQIHGWRGSAYWHSGYNSLAIQDLEQAIKLNPNYQGAKDLLKIIRGW